MDQIIGPGGQDLLLDADGPILIYRRHFHPISWIPSLTRILADYYTPSGSFVSDITNTFPHAWRRITLQLGINRLDFSSGWPVVVWYIRSTTFTRKVTGGPKFNRLTRSLCVSSMGCNSKCITEQTKQWIRKQLAATTTEPMVYSTLRHLKQNHQLQQRAKTSQRLLFLFAN